MLLPVLLMAGCLPTPPDSSSDGPTIVIYGFSIMKEALENEIYPAFSQKWQREHGIGVNFVSSFAGSETITNQILQGAPADIAILSIERDATRLRDGGANATDWREYPHHGIINRTPFVILVRKGNPKQITGFSDLARPGIRIIHPDPISSGGAQWSILAMLGSAMERTEAETGNASTDAAIDQLKRIWKNVISTPGSAREARTQFETGYGDALVTYELEGLLMRDVGTEIDIVVPPSTIFSEHPVVMIDRNVNANERGVVQAFINYLWSDEAQQAFVNHNFRSVSDNIVSSDPSKFAQIERPFTIERFGGWDKAYPEVIEQIFRDQVQKSNK